MSATHPVAVDVLSGSDLEGAVSTIVLAFAADPGARWFSPTADRYVHNMTGFTRLVAATAIAHDAAFGTQQRAGVVLCLPPDVALDEERIGEIVEPGYSESALVDATELAERVAELRPATPHWYLPIIGVDPAYQGCGFGGALMKYACERFDRDGAPAYLESSNPRNIPLYQRHGFEVLATVQVGGSPPITPMLRPAC